MERTLSQAEFLKTLAEKFDSGALRGDYTKADAQYVVAQDRHAYTVEQHALWRKLYRRQTRLLQGRACDRFIECLDKLGAADAIPQFDRITDALLKATDWRLMAVPGVVPDRVFSSTGPTGASPSQCRYVNRASSITSLSLVCSMIFRPCAFAV